MSDNNTTTTTTTTNANSTGAVPATQLSPQAEYITQDIQRIQKELQQSVFYGLVGSNRRSD